MGKEVKPSERKLLERLRGLLKCNKNGESQIVTIKKVGNKYQLGSIANQGTVEDK